MSSIPGSDSVPLGVPTKSTGEDVVGNRAMDDDVDDHPGTPLDDIRSETGSAPMDTDSDSEGDISYYLNEKRQCSQTGNTPSRFGNDSPSYPVQLTTDPVELDDRTRNGTPSIIPMSYILGDLSAEESDSKDTRVDILYWQAILERTNIYEFSGKKRETKTAA